ncbi:MAG: hypothetical protein WC637_09920 [Victivallales bacterium]|jgi:hypothetical protein
MEMSVFIAKIAAVIYLSASLGGFSGRDYYRRISDDMFKNAALTYLMGFITAIIGVIIVDCHNLWVRDWTVMITVIGWLALIKGVLIIACPNLMQRLSEPFLAEKALKIFPYVTLLLGLVFAYFGFAV